MSQYNTAKYGQSTYGTATAEHPYLLTTGKVIWRFQVDWDRDGVIGTEIEPQSIFEISWRRGRKNRIRTDGRGQEHPEQETFTIKMRDAAARYDPFNTSSPLYAYLGASGMLVRILAMSTTTLVTEPVFVGVLASITYNAQAKTATIIGEGLARYLQIGEAEELFGTNLYESFDRPSYPAYFEPDGSTPYPINYWSGRPGGLNLAVCAELTLEQAEYPFGMNNGQANGNDEVPEYFYFTGISAWETLKSLADAYAGRLAFLRNGEVLVLDRQDTLGTGAISPLTSAPLEAFGLDRPSPWEGLRNTATVVYKNQYSSRFYADYFNRAYYTKCWSNAGPIAVPAGTAHQIDIELEYGGEVVPCSYWLTNSDGAYADIWEAWDGIDKTGTYLGPSGGAGGVGIETYTIDQNRLHIHLNNTNPFTAYFFNVAVYAVIVAQTGNSGTVTVQDATSIAANGKRPMTIETLWVQDPVTAGTVAAAYVAALKDRTKASPVTLAYIQQGDSLFTALTTHDLGAVVSFGVAGGAEALKAFGLNGSWLIIGQEIGWSSADGQAATIKYTYERMA